MLLEDDIALRALMTTILRSSGHTVIQAASGSAGIESLPEIEGDEALIILDLGLPDMDGTTFLAEAQHRGFKGKVLIVTGSLEGRELARLMGAEGFLAKPFGPDELEAAVERALGS